MGKPIVISVLSDTRGLQRGLDQGRSKLRSFAKGALIGFAGAAAGAVVVGKKLIDAGERMGTANARILQINKSMGLFGAQTGKVSTRLIKLAESQARATGVDQNTIKETQAKLLTFKSLAKSADTVGGAFDRANAAAVDMAAAGFGSAQGNAVQLGKALQDPIKGITALNKSGITFTEDQKKVIKTLVETGQAGKAQGLILKAVEEQVGGTAKATANGTDRIRVGLSQVAERIGSKLTPVVDKAATLLLDKGIPAASRFAATMQKRLNPVVTRVSTTVKRFTPVVSRIAAAFSAQVVPAVSRFVGVVSGNVLPVISGMVNTFTTKVIPTVGAVAQFFSAQLLPAVVTLGTQIGGSLQPVVSALSETFRTQVLPTINTLIGKFNEARPTLQKVALVVLKVVGTGLRLGAAILGKVLPPAIRLTGFLIGKLVPAAASVVVAVIKIIGKIVSFGGTLINAGKQAGEFAKTIISKIAGIPKAIGNVSGKLLSIGKDLIGGLLQGIKDKAGELASTIQKFVIDKIPGPVRKALGIKSPSRIMSGIGKNIVEGLTLGIRNESPTVARTMKRLSTDISTFSSGVTITPKVRTEFASTAGSALGIGGLRPIVYVRLEVPVGATGEDVGRELVGYLKSYFEIGGERP